MDVFYTGSAQCVPGGPAFSLAFYQAWTTMVACVAGGVGVSIFQTCLSRTWYRRAFWVTTAVEVVAAAVDISLVNRWNLRLGISDKLFYVLGDSMLESVVRFERRAVSCSTIFFLNAVTGGGGRWGRPAQMRARQGRRAQARWYRPPGHTAHLPR